MYYKSSVASDAHQTGIGLRHVTIWKSGRHYDVIVGAIFGIYRRNAIFKRPCTEGIYIVRLSDDFLMVWIAFSRCFAQYVNRYQLILAKHSWFTVVVFTWYYLSSLQRLYGITISILMLAVKYVCNIYLLVYIINMIINYRTYPIMSSYVYFYALWLFTCYLLNWNIMQHTTKCFMQCGCSTIMYCTCKFNSGFYGNKKSICKCANVILLLVVVFCGIFVLQIMLRIQPSSTVAARQMGYTGACWCI